MRHLLIELPILLFSIITSAKISIICSPSMEDESNLCIVGSTIKVDLNTLQSNDTEAEAEQEEEEDIYHDQCAMQTPIIFIDPQQQKFSLLGKHDPKRENMTVVPGLNLKGLCTNQQCISNTNQTFQTWIPKGFGTFNMAQARFENKCYACGSAIDPESIETMGITKSKVAIFGRKKVLNEEGKGHRYKVVRSRLKEDRGCFIEFQSAKQGKVTWISLKFKVSSI